MNKTDDTTNADASDSGLTGTLAQFSDYHSAEQSAGSKEGCTRCAQRRKRHVQRILERHQWSGEQSK